MKPRNMLLWTAAIALAAGLPALAHAAPGDLDGIEIELELIQDEDEASDGISITLTDDDGHEHVISLSPEDLTDGLHASPRDIGDDPADHAHDGAEEGEGPEDMDDGLDDADGGDVGEEVPIDEIDEPEVAGAEHGDS